MTGIGGSLGVASSYPGSGLRRVQYRMIKQGTPTFLTFTHAHTQSCDQHNVLTYHTTDIDVYIHPHMKELKDECVNKYIGSK